ncbi:MAG TPA: DEAD/DEAH box helicase [Candidatus Manganitrophaceae bacterium]|nr:DEAD/DEAH box helicase [Candidatus Manganitrophaceae bacterium]
MPFQGLGLHPHLVKAIRELGYTRPTPIQAEAIPAALGGGDLIGSAQTGTGKTAAFLLPILQKILIAPGRGKTRALILAPTRELAVQAERNLRELSKHVPVRSAAVYGGAGMEPQTKALRSGVDVVIATPGRLLDHLRRGNAKLDQLEVLVLDEADRMLDMGFLPDIRKIVKVLPKNRQTMLFSATMPNEILQLSKEVLHDPLKIQIGGDEKTAVGIRHAAYPVPQHLKTELLLTLLRETVMLSVLVFTRTKHRADRLAQVLERKGFKTGRLHSNRTQSQRLASLDSFRRGHSQILVATDIAARGIDVEKISHVINFDIPGDPEAYIHRVGRTARAEAVGDAFTLISPEEEKALKIIEKSLGASLPRVKLPDFNYRAAPPSKSPHEAGAKGGPTPRGKKSPRPGDRGGGHKARTKEPFWKRRSR